MWLPELLLNINIPQSEVLGRHDDRPYDPSLYPKEEDEGEEERGVDEDAYIAFEMKNIDQTNIGVPRTRNIQTPWGRVHDEVVSLVSWGPVHNENLTPSSHNAYSSVQGGRTNIEETLPTPWTPCHYTVACGSRNRVWVREPTRQQRVLATSKEITLIKSICTYRVAAVYYLEKVMEVHCDTENDHVSLRRVRF